ncbi:hypothetical protein NDU88_001781, partial [Pleurodeles waltl]
KHFSRVVKPRSVDLVSEGVMAANGVLFDSFSTSSQPLLRGPVKKENDGYRTWERNGPATVSASSS